MSSSLDTICKKMVSSLEPGGAGRTLGAKSDSDRHISPAIAHELNNILTIIQGYTDRLLFKHDESPMLETQLKLISEASKRAATLVRTTVNAETDMRPRSHPNSPPPSPADCVVEKF
jgi:nitrogen-specific signal transduction histidine kinase